MEESLAPTTPRSGKKEMKRGDVNTFAPSTSNRDAHLGDSPASVVKSRELPAASSPPSIAIETDLQATVPAHATAPVPSSSSSSSTLLSRSNLLPNDSIISSITSPVSGTPPASFRKISSILSGEEADSEPSSGRSSIAGSCESIVHMMMMGGGGGGSNGSNGHRRNSSSSSSASTSVGRLPRLGSSSRANSFTTGLSHVAGDESDTDREVRLLTYASGLVPPSPQSATSAISAPTSGSNKNKNPSSSRLNLLVSSHLSHHFNNGGSSDPSDHPSSLTPASSSSSSSASPSPSSRHRPPIWRRIFDPYQPLSKRGLYWYTFASGAMWLLFRSASRPTRFNRSMFSFIPPFLVREAPQIFAFFTALGIARIGVQLRQEKVSPLLILSTVANVYTFVGLLRLFRRMVRVGAHPFRAALKAAGIGVPIVDEEDVLTIVPVQHNQHAHGSHSHEQLQLSHSSGAPSPSPPLQSSNDDAPTMMDEHTDHQTQVLHPSPSLSNPSAVPVPSSASPSSSSSSSSPSPSPAPDSDSDCSAPFRLPTSSTDQAYRRIGNMTPFRWFLSATQLYQVLPWYEEVQYQAGVVFEHIQTRQKTHQLKLDVYRPKVMPNEPIPCFLYIHGGGWITGHRALHSISMLYAIAKSGWLVASINYRLSPYVKHPTHLMDCKRGLAWLKRNAPLYGADPEFVVVGGESAGAHLASLMGLTQNVLYLQPGFEDVDTSVKGVIDLFGCHDLSDSNNIFRNRENPKSLLGGFDFFLHHFVIGEKRDEHAPVYDMASPYFRLKSCSPSSSTIPPFFGAHGTHDDIVPLDDSKVFFDTLKQKRAEEATEHERRMKRWEDEVNLTLVQHRQRHHQARIDATETNHTDMPSMTTATTTTTTTSHTSSMLPVSLQTPLPPPPLPPLPIMDVFIHVPHASHSFNNVLSTRTFALNDSITVWLTGLRREYQLRSEKYEKKLQLLKGGHIPITVKKNSPPRQRISSSTFGDLKHNSPATRRDSNGLHHTHQPPNQTPLILAQSPTASQSLRMSSPRTSSEPILSSL